MRIKRNELECGEHGFVDCDDSNGRDTEEEGGAYLLAHGRPCCRCAVRTQPHIRVFFLRLVADFHSLLHSLELSMRTDDAYCACGGRAGCGCVDTQAPPIDLSSCSIAHMEQS